MPWYEQSEKQTMLAGFFFFSIAGVFGLGLIFRGNGRKNRRKVGMILFVIGTGGIITVILLRPSVLASQPTSETVYYYHNDHLGTPVKMTNDIGTVVWKADYLPFGEVILNEDPDGDGQSVVNNFRFPGQYYDEETGLYYNWNRYYDPKSGRYTQIDKNSFEDQYIYVLNNPMSYYDIKGKKENRGWKAGSVNNESGEPVWGCSDTSCRYIQPGEQTDHDKEDIDFLVPTPDSPIDGHSNGSIKLGNGDVTLLPGGKEGGSTLNTDTEYKICNATGKCGWKPDWPGNHPPPPNSPPTKPEPKREK